MFLTYMFYKGNNKTLYHVFLCALEDFGYKKHLLVPAVIVMQHTKEVWRERNGMRLTSWGLLYLNGWCCQQQQWKMDDCTVTSSGNRLIDGLSNWGFLIHSSCTSPISHLSALSISTYARNIKNIIHPAFVIKTDGSHIVYMQHYIIDTQIDIGC